MFAAAVPDLIQAVVGYRTWAVDEDGWLLPFSLGPIAGPWRPGANQAVCHYAKWKGDGSRDVHAAPHPRCMCGLYALADAADPRLPRDAPALALGAVAAWGDLEVHRSGFRAEWATVVALAVSSRLPRRRRIRHERAARRYGVDLVTPELLEVTALRHAAPIPAGLLPGGPGDTGPSAPAPPPRGRARRRPARVAGATATQTPVGRGVRIDDHTWLDAATLRVGITRAFAAHLGPGPVDLVLPAVGTFHRTSDALARITGSAGETLTAWAPLTATVDRVNPTLADDPGLLLRDPEGSGWIATLVPHAWAAEAAGLEWGSTGAASYRAALAALDPWSDLRSTGLHVRCAAEVLTELRRRRVAPRFADEAAVHARLVEPLRAALAADGACGARLARLGARVGFALSDPSSGFVLDARAAPAIIVPGPVAAECDLTLALTAEAAERFLAGRLDVARALRSGELRSDAPAGRTLAVVSVLTALPVLPAAPGMLRPLTT